MGCSHIYNIFLRGEGTVSFINGTGWAFMITCISNILGNLAVVLFNTFCDFSAKLADRKREKVRTKLMKERKENRESIM